MLSISRCNNCDNKAAAKDGKIFLCTDCWFQIYGGRNGKIKEWIMDMEEDAMSMSQEEWCAKHGESVIEVYHEARRKFAEHVEGNDE